MKYLPIYVSWVLMAIVLLIVATLEATHRSKERAACYREKQSIEACSRPAQWELLLRRLIETGVLKWKSRLAAGN